MEVVNIESAQRLLGMRRILAASSPRSDTLGVLFYGGISCTNEFEAV